MNQTHVGESESASPNIVIAGGYPPPLTGMTLATALLHELLGEEYPLQAVRFADGEEWQPRDRISFRRLRAVQRYAREIAAARPRVLVYGNLSGSKAGHLRDLHAIQCATVRDTRTIGWVHNGNFADHFASPLRRTSSSWIIRRLRYLVVISDTLRRDVEGFVPADKLRVIPNTIDDLVQCDREEIGRAQARRAACNGRPLRLLYISNMIAAKGYGDLLDAASILRKRGILVRLEYAGGWREPGDQERFTKKLTRMGLAPQVTIHGPIRDRKRIRAMLLDADVFVLPSYYRYEASPMCVIEALNAGLPVISTRHAAIPDMVTHGVNGRFAKCRDPVSLANQVATMRNPGYRIGLGEAARRTFEEKFAPGVVRKAWHAIIESSLK